MNDNKPAGFDYKTHILIGCTSDHKLTVICHWPHVPRQAEVEQAARMSKEGHSTFLLCTPTSVLPVKANGIQRRRSDGRERCAVMRVIPEVRYRLVAVTSLGTMVLAAISRSATTHSCRSHGPP